MEKIWCVLIISVSFVQKWQRLLAARMDRQCRAPASRSDLWPATPPSCQAPTWDFKVRWLISTCVWSMVNPNPLCVSQLGFLHGYKFPTLPTSMQSCKVPPVLWSTITQLSFWCVSGAGIKTAESSPKQCQIAPRLSTSTLLLAQRV